MIRDKKRYVDKLNTLLFGKDLRVTKGDVFSEVYEGDFSSYLPIDKYIGEVDKPTENVCDIREFGAVADDENFLSTTAINDAIDSCCKKGGGTVIVSGGDFYTNTVKLKSNVTLYINKNAKIIASLDSSKYENESLIYCENCENVTITGGGKICGQGNFFGLKPVEKPCFEPAPVIDVVGLRRDYRAKLRFAHSSKYGFLCCMTNCKNVNINNIIFENSAYWTLRLHLCDSVDIHNFVINNNRHVANTDGIDLVGTSNVKITKTFISTCDDAICLKNAVWEKCEGDMKNIYIAECEIITRTNAFKIGTETTFDICDILIENCKFFMTDIYPGSVSGISIEACDGSKVYNITARNIEMDRVTCPLFIRLGNRNRAAEVDENTARAKELNISGKAQNTVDKNKFDFLSEINDIVIENIKATNIEIPVIISGVSQKGKGTKCVNNVKLSNFDLSYRKCKEVYDRRLFIPEYADVYPECWRFRNLPSYAIWARHVRNLQVNSFKCSPAQTTWKEENIYIDVK